MSPKFPVNNFEWIKNTSQFNEDFIKNNNKESDKGYFPEVVVKYTKIEKVENIAANLHDETEYVNHIKI